MNSYTWDIRGFKLEDRGQYQDVVNTVLFRITATDPTGVYSRTFNSEAYLSCEQLDNFVPFAQLDQDTVVAWIKSCFTVEDYAKTLLGLDTSLAQYIDEQINNARIVTELPWGGAVVNPTWGSFPNPEDYAQSAAENPL
jgi:hypothetical protein